MYIFSEWSNFMKYWALVLRVDRKKTLGDLLASARAEAKKKFGLKRGRVEVHEVLYVPRLDVNVAVFSTPEVRGERMINGL